MFTKKEIIITILGILAGATLIFFLPTIENKLSNRKVYEYEFDEEKRLIVDKYVCTFASNSNLLKSNIEATFYINEEKVTRIYTRKTETYTKKENYEEALKGIQKNIDTEDHTLKIAQDNINWTIITTEAQNIKEGTKVSYPTAYEELKKYLETNNYTCTIRYKNS